MSDWLVIAIVLLVVVLAIWQTIQLLQIRKQVDAVPKDGNVFALIDSTTGRLNRVEAGLAVLDQRVQDIEARIPFAVTRNAVVAYDAFGNIAGQLSRSMALLSESGDGIVLSILVSREETLFFTKEIRGGTGSEMLSPEEELAVANAMGR
ncbi:MAG: DUF4446 family protein [Actinomycetota bacterium]|nr:DUF4446 family protein [Actinomycetota bacterium]